MIDLKKFTDTIGGMHQEDIERAAISVLSKVLVDKGITTIDELRGYFLDYTENEGDDWYSEEERNTLTVKYSIDGKGTIRTDHVGEFSPVFYQILVTRPRFLDEALDLVPVLGEIQGSFELSENVYPHFGSEKALLSSNNDKCVLKTASGQSLSIVITRESIQSSSNNILFEFVVIDGPDVEKFLEQEGISLNNENA